MQNCSNILIDHFTIFEYLYPNDQRKIGYSRYAIFICHNNLHPGNYCLAKKENCWNICDHSCAGSGLCNYIFLRLCNGIAQQYPGRGIVLAKGRTYWHTNLTGNVVYFCPLHNRQRNMAYIQTGGCSFHHPGGCTHCQLYQ